MPCTSVTLPDGSAAIVCSRGPRRQRCACGKPATRLCDWKVPATASEGGHATRATCDAPICASCSTSPAPEKDLCPTHAAAFAQWQARRPPSTGAATGQKGQTA